MKSKMGGWENAKPFYFFFKNFWKEIIIHKTFLTVKKKMLEKEKGKRKRKNQQQPILATYDPAKAVFVITTPGETWAMTCISQCLMKVIHNNIKEFVGFAVVSYGLTCKLWPNYQDFLVSGPVMLGFVFIFK